MYCKNMERIRMTSLLSSLLFHADQNSQLISKEPSLLSIYLLPKENTKMKLTILLSLLSFLAVAIPLTPPTYPNTIVSELSIHSNTNPLSTPAPSLSHPADISSSPPPSPLSKQNHHLPNQK
jgi:hypothetical protein